MMANFNQQNVKNNRQWTLASRPVGAPKLSDFNFVESEKPGPKQGELLLRTVYLSLDPYMRGRMSDAKSYAEPVAINEVMVGGTVCRVEQSNHPDYEVGEWVVSYSG
jgi:NADPH-dependent curcumin reductase CurA